ncbi:kinesin-like nuclear fusion protein, partial [Podila epigama]
MEQPKDGPPSDPLNRSISKLKPPTKIKSSVSTSSAISTTLAVASAVGALTKENSQPAVNTPHNANSNVPQSAMSAPVKNLKRKAEEPAINKRLKSDPAKLRTTTVSSVATAVGTRRPVAVPTTATRTTRVAIGATATASRLTTSRQVQSKTVAPPVKQPLRKAVAPKITPTARPARPAVSSTRPIAVARKPTVSTLSSNRKVPPQPSTSAKPRVVQRQPRPSQSATSQASSSHESKAETSCIPIFNSIASALPTLTRAKGEKRGQREDAEDLCQILTGLDQYLASLIEAKKKEVAEITSENKSIEDKVAAKKKEEDDALELLSSMQRDIEGSARKREEELSKLSAQHALEMKQYAQKEAQLKREIESTETNLKKTKTQLEEQVQEGIALRATISTQSANLVALESRNKALQESNTQVQRTLEEKEAKINELKDKIQELETSIKTIEERIRTEETIRRRLHNTIQELKGNIRVFCRVRPVTTNANASKAETTTATISYPDDEEGKKIEFAHSKASATGSQIEKSYPFTFDRVFQPSSTQQDVFDEISQLVQSALDGYNVCIFAYGQTGSGKTYTMEGPLNATKESMGMIPRSVLQIYETAKELESKGWKYTMEGQYVEIYNETINDLLGTYSTDQTRKHEIRHTPGGKTTITDITTVVLTSPERVAALLKKAAHNRSIGSTQMNERSSRSHCVFTLRLTGANSITNETSEGVLNLIDLAGSERLSQSGATGDRLRETQAINKSLSCLGDVIYAIANKDTHVPYRNSKLTYLLQNSLGGNSKTLMFVNISPLMSNFGETLCSLRFATK